MARIALIAGAFAALLVSLGTIAPIGAALGLFAVMCWFAVPGVVLARRLYGPRSGWLAPWLAGPAWGYVLSSLVLLALWAAGVRSAPGSRYRRSSQRCWSGPSDGWGNALPARDLAP